MALNSAYKEPHARFGHWYFCYEFLKVSTVKIGFEKWMNKSDKRRRLKKAPSGFAIDLERRMIQISLQTLRQHWTGASIFMTIW
jgi:hypothetical protein